MNIPIPAWFALRSWKTTPLKYGLYSVVAGSVFGGLVSVIHLSFFGGFAFAAVIVGSHVTMVVEREAWTREKVAGRNGTLNQALSYVSASVPFVLALIAWMLA